MKEVKLQRREGDISPSYIRTARKSPAPHIGIEIRYEERNAIFPPLKSRRCSKVIDNMRRNASMPTTVDHLELLYGSPNL
jgi:hypothetical protein